MATRKDCIVADLSGTTQQDLGQLLSSMRKICDDIQSSTRRFGSPSHLRSSLRRRRSETASTNAANNSDPISFVDSLDQARRILEQRGIITAPTAASQADPVQSAPEEPGLPDENPSAALEVARPVLELGHENALAHLTAFRDHLFPVYPCIDLSIAKKNIDSLFRTSLLSFADGAQDLGVDLIDIEATKAVLAIGMLIQGDSASPLSSSLESHLIWNADNIMRRDQAQIEDVIMGALLVSPSLSSLSAFAGPRGLYTRIGADHLLHVATRDSEGLAGGRPHGPVCSRGRTSQREILPKR